MFRRAPHHSQGELRIKVSKLNALYEVAIFIVSQSIKYTISKLYKATYN